MIGSVGFAVECFSTIVYPTGQSAFYHLTRNRLRSMEVAVANKAKTAGRFASLMELYEDNYLQMRLLVPKLKSMQNDLYISSAAGCLDLELSELEQNRYTTTFNLTYRFNSQQEGLSAREEREPNLTIRLYHDARTCEVVTGILRLNRDDQRCSRNLDLSWRQNRFLQKWVRYCLRQGHRFIP